MYFMLNPRVINLIAFSARLFKLNSLFSVFICLYYILSRTIYSLCSDHTAAIT